LLKGLNVTAVLAWSFKPQAHWSSFFGWRLVEGWLVTRCKALQCRQQSLAHIYPSIHSMSICLCCHNHELNLPRNPQSKPPCLWIYQEDHCNVGPHNTEWQTCTSWMDTLQHRIPCDPISQCRMNSLVESRSFDEGCQVDLRSFSQLHKLCHMGNESIQELGEQCQKTSTMCRCCLCLWHSLLCNSSSPAATSSPTAWNPLGSGRAQCPSKQGQRTQGSPQAHNHALGNQIIRNAVLWCVHLACICLWFSVVRANVAMILLADLKTLRFWRMIVLGAPLMDVTAQADIHIANGRTSVCKTLLVALRDLARCLQPILNQRMKINSLVGVWD